jgi:hypothetical protein
MVRSAHQLEESATTFRIQAYIAHSISRCVLRSSLVGTEKKHKYSKKVRFGGAPVLDEEYGATVTHKECDEDSVENHEKWIFI